LQLGQGLGAQHHGVSPGIHGVQHRRVLGHC
jgi:hypothetical protein